MLSSVNSDVKRTGQIPYRIALAGGWIDQPFVSRLNPKPPGSMVVVSLEPVSEMMERAGLATGTRNVAKRLWNGSLPDRDPAELVRELYAAENEGKPEPSGSQDMIGIIYPGINRLDYDADHEGGLYPVHIESLQRTDVAAWVEDVIHLVPVAQRPDGYNPLGVKNLDPQWIGRLGQCGRACYDSLAAMDLGGLGASMNECMRCWEAILPHTVDHPTLRVDLKDLLRQYQSRYSGAMYSGCGGGYLLVASREPVPGSFRIQVRLGRPRQADSRITFAY
jgi:hypothetical protein